MTDPEATIVYNFTRPDRRAKERISGRVTVTARACDYLDWWRAARHVGSAQLRSRASRAWSRGRLDLSSTPLACLPHDPPLTRDGPDCRYALVEARAHNSGDSRLVPFRRRSGTRASTYARTSSTHT
jgi:hypothetical protein